MAPETVLDESLLIVGYALLGVPFVTFVVSRFGPSIFHDRYLIPASLGLMPILAHFMPSGGLPVRPYVREAITD